MGQVRVTTETSGENRQAGRLEDSPQSIIGKARVLRRKRVLLVEDEEAVRLAFRMLLEIDEHVVAEASSGSEALKVFATSCFDLVITDFEMPGMKGNELAVRIKELAPKQPILMITAYDRSPGVANPVDAILSKPLTLEELRGGMAHLVR